MYAGTYGGKLLLASPEDLTCQHVTPIKPRKGDTRYVRTDAKGRFTKDQVSKGKSLASDRRRKSKTVAKKGYGDRADQKRG